MVSRRQLSFPLTILALLLYAISFVLLCPGSDSDVPFGVFQWVGMLAAMGFLLLSFLGWGRVLLAGSGAALGVELALGCAVAAILVALLGAAGFLGPSYQVLFALLGLGGVLASEVPGKRPNGETEREWPGPLALLVVALVFLRFCRASLLHTAVDPLYYHLEAPRLWWEQGGIRFHPELPFLFQARYWEYLALYAMQLFEWQPGRGLIEGQVLGQWLHAILGNGGCGLVLYAWARRSFKIPAAWCGLVALAGVAVPHLIGASLAKNDWGISLWTLAGLALLPLFREERSGGSANGRALLAAGILLGVAVAGKFNAAFTVLPLFAVSFFWRFRNAGMRNTVREHGAIAVVALLAAAPIFLRNLLATGNPFFPEYSVLLSPDFLSPSELAHQELWYATAPPPGFLTHARRIALMLFDENVWLILFAFLPALSTRKFDKRFALISGASFVALLALEQMRLRSVRYIGPLLPFGAAFGIVALYFFLRETRADRKWLPWALAGVLLFRSDLFFFRGSMDVYRVNQPYLPGDQSPLVVAPWEWATAPNLALQLRTWQIAGESKAWLRMHAQPADTILYVADPAPYYLPAARVLPYTAKAVEAAVPANLDPEALVGTLQKLGVTYVLNTYQWDEAAGRAITQQMQILARKYPRGVLFQDTDATVLGVKELAEAAASRTPGGAAR